MIRSAALSLALLALATPVIAQPTPAPAPAPTAAAAQLPATVPPAVVRFTGQLLDVRGGFAYFSTGDAVRMIDAVRVVDYDTGQPTTVQPHVKMFARAAIDPTSKLIFELAITKRRLATSGDLSFLRPFVVVQSTKVPAPEIIGQKLTGRPVAVTFEITAPPTTQLTDQLYISTDAGNWNAQEIKLDRVDAYKYRAQRTYASGTKFSYRVTRGSWNSVERGENNLDPDPHKFFVREVDSLAARTTVYHWSDENPAAKVRGQTRFQHLTIATHSVEDPGASWCHKFQLHGRHLLDDCVCGDCYRRDDHSSHGRPARFFRSHLAVVAHGNVRLNGLPAPQALMPHTSTCVAIASSSRATRARTGKSSDALAIDIDRGRVDAFDITAGSVAGDFAFPDIDPTTTYIRARRMTLVTHATVRFAPAAFPSSLGAPPVPSYLYALYDSSGFSAQSLTGATFDQPYHLAGNATSLYSAHFRFVDGLGPDIAFDHHLVDGERAFVVTSLEAPSRTSRTLRVNAYQRLGDRYTATFDASGERDASYAHLATSAAFGGGGARLDLSAFSGGGASAELSVRTADRPFLLRSMYRLRATFGVDAQRGGVLPELVDRGSYTTLWHHGIDAFLASPQVHGPLGTTLGSTFDLATTWYGFPRRRDTFSASLSASRPFGKTITVFGTYSESLSAEHYGQLQGLFFPQPAVTFATPDGTPWPGYSAFSGATTSRSAQIDTQWVTSPSTTFRVSFAHTNDFPQYNGFGRPQNELRVGARFRPAPNFGIDLSRSYDFAWGAGVGCRAGSYRFSHDPRCSRGGHRMPRSPRSARGWWCYATRTDDRVSGKQRRARVGTLVRRYGHRKVSRAPCEREARHGRRDPARSLPHRTAHCVGNRRPPERAYRGRRSATHTGD